MAELIAITDWDKHFEINRTRELKEMTWLALPNRLDGDGYTELVDHPNGAAHFGAWVIMLEVASRCDPRGTLIRDNNEPHTPQSLARMSRLPATVFGEVIPRLQAIGWLTVTTIPHEGATISQVDAAIPQEGVPTDRQTRQTNKTEQNTSRTKNVGGDVPSRFDEFWALYPVKHGRANAVNLWSGRKPLIDGEKQDLDPIADQIVAAVRSQIVEHRALKRASQFVAEWKNGDSWLYNRRWEDGISQTTTAKINNGVDVAIAARQAQVAQDEANVATAEERREGLASIGQILRPPPAQNESKQI